MLPAIKASIYYPMDLNRSRVTFKLEAAWNRFSLPLGVILLNRVNGLQTSGVSMRVKLFVEWKFNLNRKFFIARGQKRKGILEWFIVRERLHGDHKTEVKVSRSILLWDVQTERCFTQKWLTPRATVVSCMNVVFHSSREIIIKVDFKSCQRLGGKNI